MKKFKGSLNQFFENISNTHQNTKFLIINFSDTTHLICARSGTQKYRQAKKEKIKIVNPAWLWVTYHNWEKQTEDNFELPDIASPEDLEGLKFQMFEIGFENFTESYVT